MQAGNEKLKFGEALATYIYPLHGGFPMQPQQYLDVCVYFHTGWPPQYLTFIYCVECIWLTHLINGLEVSGVEVLYGII